MALVKVVSMERRTIEAKILEFFHETSGGEERGEQEDGRIQAKTQSMRKRGGSGRGIADGLEL